MPLGKILGGVQLPPSPDLAAGDRAYWRDAITSLADDETEQAVQDKTDWDEKGYWWFGTGPPAYEVRDRVVLFDMTRGACRTSGHS